MSHQLSLQVKNDSSYTLLTYSVAHSWDGHNELLKGTNLANGGTLSPSIQITSGYTQFDWYTVQLEFDTIGVRQTNFYCNSSYDQNKCIMDLHDGSLDCKYYENDTYMTGCDNKAYSGLYMDEQNQIDPVKIDPSTK
jgi:hypothetical protein